MPMDDDDPEQDAARQKLEHTLRLWLLIAVAAVLLVLGIWAPGREIVGFLANWSTFVLQIGAIYLFVFEQKFLANLVLDFLDWAATVKAWNALRAQEREAAREAKRAAAAAKAAQASAAAKPSSATAKPTSSAQPQPIQPQPAATKPLPAAGPRPEFHSRDPSFLPKALTAIGFVVLLGFVVWSAFQWGQGNEQVATTAPATTTDAATDAAQAAETPPAPAPAQPWTYTVRQGDSCMGLGERIHPTDARAALAVCIDLQTANPSVTLRPFRSDIDPGDHLTIPAEITRASLETW